LSFGECEPGLIGARNRGGYFRFLLRNLSSNDGFLRRPHNRRFEIRASRCQGSLGSLHPAFCRGHNGCLLLGGGNGLSTLALGNRARLRKARVGILIKQRELE
jgi:hypothetical protein